MPNRPLRTADYDQRARNRLGKAVRDARIALGFKARPGFAALAGISLRSLVDIENGQAGIGEINLRAVARALPGWDDGTPRAILEGAPVPESPAAPEYPGAAVDGLTFVVTDRDRARWQEMSLDAIIDEGGMIGRTISPRMQLLYLRAALAQKAGSVEADRP